MKEKKEGRRDMRGKREEVVKGDEWERGGISGGGRRGKSGRERPAVMLTEPLAVLAADQDCEHSALVDNMTSAACRRNFGGGSGL